MLPERGEGCRCKGKTPKTFKLVSSKENDKKNMFCSKVLIKLNRELVSMKLSKISSANVVTIVVAHSKSLFHSRGHNCMK